VNDREKLDPPRLFELLAFLTEFGELIGLLAAGVAENLPAALRDGMDSDAAWMAGDAADQLEGLIDELHSVTRDLHPLLERLVHELPTLD
jgi:hypothetical protein